MRMEDYVAWAAGAEGKPAGLADDLALAKLGLGFAAAVGAVLDRVRDGVADGAPVPALGELGYRWARLCALADVGPSLLLARHRAHAEWRRAGRPPGGPPPAEVPLPFEDYARWAMAIDGGVPKEARAIAELALRLGGDAGEISDILHRRLEGGAWPAARFAGELGDVLFYWVRLCAIAGLLPAELLVRR
jgi:NTP pyrophosphatase (non-canonical NTP hydrolase)